MQIDAIIQARMGSTRFPGKVLYGLAGKPVLQHVIDRVRQAARVRSVIVAIPLERGTDAIAGHCAHWDVPCYVDPGRPENVLGRFVGATLGMGDDQYVIRVCGDNPLVVPSAIDGLVEAMSRQATTSGRVDYAGYRDDDGWLIRRPSGLFAEIVRVGALRRADAELPADDPGREHVTEPIYRSNRYDCFAAVPPAWWLEGPKDFHAAVDTPADLGRLEELLADRADATFGSDPRFPEE